MKNFAITGAAGYIAPRHLKAIRDTGNNLVAALDPHDSVGILDRFFPEVSFFTEFERFDRHLEKLRRKNNGQEVQYLSICSPNNLHDAHIRFSLRIGADAICEKPIVLNPWNLDALQELEHETGKRVFNILQLRLHPELIRLKSKIEEKKTGKYEVCLTYITSRGPWYNYSWKGDVSRSGGVATNIGVHLFDLMIWLFGSVQKSFVYLSEHNRLSGFMELNNANIRWFLSTDKNDLPAGCIAAGQSTFRSITMDDSEIEFTDGFTELHTKVYEEILAGRGFSIDDVRPSIEAVYQIRNAGLSDQTELLHPLLKEKQSIKKGE